MSDGWASAGQSMCTHPYWLSLDGVSIINFTRLICLDPAMTARFSVHPPPFPFPGRREIANTRRSVGSCTRTVGENRDHDDFSGGPISNLLDTCSRHREGVVIGTIWHAPSHPPPPKIGIGRVEEKVGVKNTDPYQEKNEPIAEYLITQGLAVGT